MGEKIERNYKDTVFRMLFKEKENLIELYNAVNGTNYQNLDELQVITLENAIYMNVKNDIACILDLRMQLYEHQSTVNPNMPLRDLIYVSKELEAYIQRNKLDLYAKKQIIIPTPRFIVFYNGVEIQPERTELKLSDAFAIKNEKINLELCVEVFNINIGYNTELLEACKTLHEYCIYVGKVRKYAENLPIEDAVDKAVDECIKENVLCEFLTNQKAEAKAMSIFEYDEEKHRKLLLREGYEDGVKDGIEQGKHQGKLDMIYTFLLNGGKKEDAVKLLGATEEDLVSVKEKFQEGEFPED